MSNLPKKEWKSYFLFKSRLKKKVMNEFLDDRKLVIDTLPFGKSPIIVPDHLVDQNPVLKKLSLYVIIYIIIKIRTVILIPKIENRNKNNNNIYPMIIIIIIIII